LHGACRRARKRWPGLWNATAHVATLQPGDALFIPHEWLHEAAPLSISRKTRTRAL
jgi:hypothetical protein